MKAAWAYVPLFLPSSSSVREPGVFIVQLRAKRDSGLAWHTGACAQCLGLQLPALRVGAGCPRPGGACPDSTLCRQGVQVEGLVWPTRLERRRDWCSHLRKQDGKMRQGSGERYDA